MIFTRLILSVLAITFISQSVEAETAQLPTWIAKLIASQPRKGGDVIEEVSYQGRRAFEILPADRAADSGNEHVLHAEDGHIICEYGGFAGHVTAGSCVLSQIKYVRTLFSHHKG